MLKYPQKTDESQVSLCAVSGCKVQYGIIWMMLTATILIATTELAQLSLCEMASNSVAVRIERADPARARARFVNYEMNAPSDRYVVNTNFWLKDVDFSCVSPWNSTGGRTRAGTAISRRHIVFARHFPIAKGARIVFTDDVIGPCPCRLTDTREIPRSDIVVGLLDSELTPNITPAKVLPEGFEKWLVDGSMWPVVTFNQHEEVTVSELSCTWNDKLGRMMLANKRTRKTRWAPFSSDVKGGDSGNPAFLLVGNQPVLLYCLQSPGAGHGPFLHKFRKEIQKAMDELCPGYKLDEFQFQTAIPRK